METRRGIPNAYPNPLEETVTRLRLLTRAVLNPEAVTDEEGLRF